MPKRLKFPPNAKAVFTGDRWRVYQWDQVLYDGSSAIFEGVARADTTKVIAEVDGKFVYTRQSQSHRPDPYFELPGGLVEEGEEPLDGAKREFLEEAGYESDDWELLCLKENPSEQIQWDVYFYYARNCRKVAEPTPDAGEKVEVFTADFDEYVKIPGLFRGRLGAEELKQLLKRGK